MLASHVQEIVVAGLGGEQSRGQKSDKRNAFALAAGLGRYGVLRELTTIEYRPS